MYVASRNFNMSEENNSNEQCAFASEIIFPAAPPLGEASTTNIVKIHADYVPMIEDLFDVVAQGFVQPDGFMLVSFHGYPYTTTHECFSAACEAVEYDDEDYDFKSAARDAREQYVAELDIKISLGRALSILTSGPVIQISLTDRHLFIEAWKNEVERVNISVRSRVESSVALNAIKSAWPDHRVEGMEQWI